MNTADTPRVVDTQVGTSRKPNGPAAAAILAAGIGIFATGLMTTLAEAWEGLSNALIWSVPVGPLSGKTGVGVIVWLIAWAALASAYAGKDVEIAKVTRWAWLLIVLGLLLTFPPVFGLFAK